MNLFQSPRNWKDKKKQQFQEGMSINRMNSGYKEGPVPHQMGSREEILRMRKAGLLGNLSDFKQFTNYGEEDLAKDLSETITNKTKRGRDRPSNVASTLGGGKRKKSRKSRKSKKTKNNRKSKKSKKSKRRNSKKR